MSNSIRIMGIDPGFANIGVARLSFDAEEGYYLHGLHLITTKKNTKKKGIRSKSDDLRRLLEVVQQFEEIVVSWPADVYSFEECPSISANVTSTRKIATGWGACCAIAARRSNVMVLEYAISDLKEVVTGNRKASKEEMIATLGKRFPQLLKMKVAKGKLEHPADGLAACLTATKDPAVLSLANALRRVST